MTTTRIPVPSGPGRTIKVGQSFEQQIAAKEEATRKRRELFDALARFIHANHEWLVSGPHEQVLRVETRPDDDLIDRLAERGLNPRLIGSATKVVGGKFIPIHCYNLTIK